MPLDQPTSPLTQGMADIEPGLRMHFVTAEMASVLSCFCMDSRRPGGNGTV